MTTVTREITEDEKVIASMLVENTGTHMLDSGGAYGRAWQRNQAAVGDQDPAEFFRATPEAKWGNAVVYPHPNFRDGKDPLKQRAELWVTVSVFHWLSENVTYNAELDKAFSAYCTAEDEKAGDEWNQKGWLQLMSEFPEHWARLNAVAEANDRNRDMDDDDERYLPKDVYEPPTGIYGDGEPMIEYTYNFDNVLSQDIQFCYWTHEGEEYALIQIHGGCDARGGFTRPRAFDVSIDDGWLDFARAACGCDKCDARWYSDSAGNGWMNDDGHPTLDDMPAREGTFVEAAFLCLNGGLLIGDESPTLIIEEKGEYGDKNVVWCPICGEGEITPYMY